MKFLPLFVLSFFALFSLLISCGKIELPSTEEKKTDTTSVDTTDNDAPNVIPAGIDTLTVEEVLSQTSGSYVLLRGYIVGYCSGTGMPSAVFGVAVSTANTNMLLASSPDETDVAKCLPVKLEVNKTGRFREDINLYDHPENYKRCIVVYGRTGTYFKVNGIVSLTAYSWCADNSKPATPDTPENPTDTTNTPTIDDHPTDNVDGR